MRQQKCVYVYLLSMVFLRKGTYNCTLFLLWRMHTQKWVIAGNQTLVTHPITHPHILAWLEAGALCTQEAWDNFATVVTKWVPLSCSLQFFSLTLWHLWTSRKNIFTQKIIIFYWCFMFQYEWNHHKFIQPEQLAIPRHRRLHYKTNDCTTRSTDDS